MTTLRIELEIGAERMQSASDAANAIHESLAKQASSLFDPFNDHEVGTVRDHDGNPVGIWEVSPGAPAHVLYLGEMETEHFAWRALGSDQQDAGRLIARAFRLHLTQMSDGDEEAALDRFIALLDSDATPESLRDDNTFAGFLADYYGINTFPLQSGQALRDSDVMPL